MTVNKANTLTISAHKQNRIFHYFLIFLFITPFLMVVAADNSTNNITEKLINNAVILLIFTPLVTLSLINLLPKVKIDSINSKLHFRKILRWQVISKNAIKNWGIRQVIIRNEFGDRHKHSFLEIQTYKGSKHIYPLTNLTTELFLNKKEFSSTDINQLLVKFFNSKPEELKNIHLENKKGFIRPYILPIRYNLIYLLTL
jgi:hypothetical protein